MNDCALLLTSIPNELQSTRTEASDLGELKRRTKEVTRETLQRQRNGKIKDVL